MHTDQDLEVDTDGLTVCPEQACGRPVREVVLESGKRLLVDPAPHELGSVVQAGGGYRVLSGSMLPAEQAAWRPHAQTCLASLRNRRRAWQAAPVRPRAGGPVCGVCRQPLDEALAGAGMTTHPSC